MSTFKKSVSDVIMYMLSPCVGAIFPVLGSRNNLLIVGYIPTTILLGHISLISTKSNEPTFTHIKNRANLKLTCSRACTLYEHRNKVYLDGYLICERHTHTHRQTDRQTGRGRFSIDRSPAKTHSPGSFLYLVWHSIKSEK